MKIIMAATSAYDKSEVHIFLTSEPGETIRVHDIIVIPMIDHSFTQREIETFVSHKKKGRLPVKIENGESGEAIIRNINSGRIKTESNFYLDDDMTGAVCEADFCNGETIL